MFKDFFKKPEFKNTLKDLSKIILIYFVFALFINVLLECFNRKSVISGVKFLIENPILWIFGTLIVLFTYEVSLFFKRRIFVFCLVNIFWIGIGVVDFIMLQYRVTPFSAVDFSLIKSAIDVSSHYFSGFGIVLIILGLLAVTFFIVILFLKCPQDSKKDKVYIIIPSFAFVLDIIVILLFINFSYPVYSLKDNYTNITEVYKNYGFVYCFANSVVDSGIEKPESYSNEKIDDLLKNLHKVKNNTKKPNIIFVQLESFFDVTSVKGMTFSKDPIPNFHSLQKKYSHGYLTVPTVGAGTVNTEFEMLTGMSQLDFGTSEYPYKTQLKDTTCESICYDLKNEDYKCHVVHNNTATFYERNKVFKNLGFDTFQTLEFMKNISKTPNGWAKDACLTKEVIDSLDATKESDFILAITVQSHGIYDIEGYENTHLTCSGGPETFESQFNYYVDQIYEVDKMIGELTEALEKRDEETIVFFYGDHLPTLGLTKDDLKNGSIYQTDYLIWDNFNLQKKNMNIKSYQVYPYLLNMIGIHDGIINKFHQQYDWNAPDYQESLKELEYDFLYGDNYLYGGENPFVPTELQLGTHKLVFDSINDEDGVKYAKGKYFSDYTKLYFNGEEVEGTVLNTNNLRIDGEIEIDEDADVDYETWDEEKKLSTERPNSFKIVVENKSGVILSQTDPIYYKDLNYQ